MRRGFFEDDVRRRLAKVGGEIAEQELGQRAGAKGGEAEAALDQPDDIKARSFHSDARKVHGIGDVAGIALTGLAEQRGAVDPHPRGLECYQRFANAGSLLGVRGAVAINERRTHLRHKRFQPSATAAPRQAPAEKSGSRR